MLNLNNNENDDKRIKGSLFGFFVGDALGVPVEFIEREELKKNKVTKMLEYGTHNQPIGTWSDDSSMVIATIDSLINNKGINYTDIMNNFLKWYEEGKYTPNGQVFDIGNATSSALYKYKKDKTTYICGSKNIYSNGNGSLMRILPISLYLHYTDDSMFDIINNISSMTHAHIYSILSCIIYSVLINEYLKEQDIKKAYLNMQSIIKKVLDDENNKALGDINDLKQNFNRIIYNDISKLKEQDIKSSGYVIDSLEASIWSLLNTNNYKDAVLKAVNLGNDTDTIGALTGGLAGLVYGYNNIPKKWIDNLKQKEYLTKLVKDFNELIIKEKKKRIIYAWESGLGDMNKLLNGEDPLPKKDIKANANSWQCTPFSISTKIDCHIVLTPAEFKLLSMGHIPEVMEDHWFMYSDKNSINYFRSWTGIQIFKGYYKIENGSYIIYLLEVNNNKEEYNEPNKTKSLNLFNYLIESECKTNKKNSK
ncbi:MAG: ADP-ribosylglycohydrolase family protein [Bacilli bacterium]|nr:ADP-ribosylglycohydrolase family protein [Bacilli bacterium]